MQTLMKGSGRFFLWPVICLVTMLLFKAAPVDAGQLPKILNQVSEVTFDNLQTAIDAANPGDTLLIQGINVGNYVITKDLNLEGRGGALLDGGNAGTVLTIFTPIAATQAVTVNLTNLTIQEGLARSIGGGGILDVSANVILNDCDVINNASPLTQGGGGILVLTSNEAPFGAFLATLTLIDTNVKFNTTTFSGGGIANFGGLVLIEDDSKILGNVADRTGGGIFSFEGTNTIIDSILQSNAAGLQGGGLENFFGSITTITDSKVKHNTAGQAGGIYNGSGANLSVEDTRFQGNSSFTLAGALFNDSGATAALNDSKIVENSSVSAGGIFNNVGGVLSLTDVKFKNNIPDDIVNLNP